MGGKGLVIFTIVLLPLTVMAKGKLVHQSPRPLTKQEVRFLDNLFTRCDDGSGSDCNSYGQALIELDPRGNARLGARYIRRACALAFRPACGKKVSESEFTREDSKTLREGCLTFSMKTITSDPVNLPGGAQGQMVTSISKDSPLIASGLQIGDIIIKLNNEGAPNFDPSQMKLPEGAKAPDPKAYGMIPTLEINRKGAPMTLPVRCK